MLPISVLKKGSSLLIGSRALYFSRTISRRPHPKKIPGSRILFPVIVLVCICLYIPGFSETAGIEARPDEKRPTLFKKAVENYLKTNIEPHTPGYAVGLIADGRIILAKGAGVRQNGKAALIDTRTVFRLASVSKTFTSGLVARLPRLTWDAKVNHYLPRLKLSNADYQKDLSLRHLLSQSTGLLPHAYTNLVQDGLSYARIVKKLESVDFICAPGACYGYQNVVYSLAGNLIAASQEKSYEALVAKKIFKPLKMADSSFGLEAFTETGNRAWPHTWDRTEKVWTPVQVRENYYRLPPAAGVNSSLNDMMSWLKAQLGHHPRVFSATSLKEMHQKQVKTTPRQSHYKGRAWNGVENTGYALGWRNFDFNGETGFVHHGGWVQGFRSEMVFNPRLNMGVVYLSNSQSKRVSEIVPNVLRLYLNHMLDKTLPVYN